MKNDPVRSNNSTSKEANFFFLFFFLRSAGEENAFCADGRGVGLENTESSCGGEGAKLSAVRRSSDFCRSRSRSMFSFFCGGGGCCCDSCQTLDILVRNVQVKRFFIGLRDLDQVEEPQRCNGMNKKLPDAT